MAWKTMAVPNVPKSKLRDFLMIVADVFEKHPEIESIGLTITRRPAKKAKKAVKRGR